MRRHYGRERTVQEFLASEDAVHPAVREDAAPTSPAPAFVLREEQREDEKV
jgi:hypothetical protein